MLLVLKILGVLAVDVGVLCLVGHRLRTRTVSVGEATGMAEEKPVAARLPAAACARERPSFGLRPAAALPLVSAARQRAVLT